MPLASFLSRKKALKASSDAVSAGRSSGRVCAGCSRAGTMPAASLSSSSHPQPSVQPAGAAQALTAHEAHARRQRLLQRLHKLGAFHVAAQLQLQRLDAAAVDQRLAEVVVALKEAAPAVGGPQGTGRAGCWRAPSACTLRAPRTAAATATARG